MPSSSTVSNILRSFQSEDSRIAEEIAPNVYKLEDKFLELWAAKYVFNNLETKIDASQALFEHEKLLRNSIVVNK